MIKLTAVICTHNRFELLKSAIDSINVANKTNDFNISLLVIANACTDNTVNKLKNYTGNKASVKLTISEEPKIGKSYALNHAIKLINTGYLCFIDDDQRIDKNYFLAIIEALTIFPNATLLCGPLFPDWRGDEADWIQKTGIYKTYPLPVPSFDLGKSHLKVEYENQLPPGGQLIVHRDVFNRIGVFNESMGPTGHNLVGGEDTEFLLRAIHKNEAFYYIPNIIQYHYIDKNRLKISYLIKLSFERNKSLTKIKLLNKNRIPIYLWRKLLIFTLRVFFSFNKIKIRFYLMRVASTLGEISAYIR